MADNFTLDKEIASDTLLDDLPDLAGFVTLLSGAYVVVAEKGIEERELSDKNYYALDLTVKSVEEVSEKLGEGDTTPKPGDIQSLLFDRQHQISMGNFKDIIKPIAERFGCKTVGDVIEASKGLELLIMGKRTYNKDKDRHNFNVKKLAIV